MAKVQIKSEKLTPFGEIFSIMEQFDALLKLLHNRKNFSKRSEFLRFYLYFCHVIQSFICFLFATLR